jgi:hypothetical protein
MPKLTQGDIFDAAKRSQLAVVFGHIGFNLMSVHWSRFADQIRDLSSISDPFLKAPRQPIAWGDGRWIWMLPTGETGGLTAVEHEKALGEAVAWAIQHEISSIVTNGAGDTSSEMQIQRARAEWLIAYVSEIEASHGITIELISLSNIYLSTN